MRYLPAFVAALFMSGPAFSSDGLLDVFQAAQLNDAQIAAARAELAAGMATAEQGRAQLQPSIGLSGSSSRNDMTAPLLSKQPYRYNTDTFTLSINQPIYRKFNLASYAQADVRVKGAEMVFAIAQQDLIVRIATAYFDVLRAQDIVTLLQAQHNAIEEQLTQAKRLFEAKVGTLTDLDEAKARFDETVAQEIEAKNTLDIKQRVLQRSIGKRSVDIRPLATFPLVAPQPPDLSHWIDTAAQQSPNVILKQVNVDFLNQEIEKSRAGHFPTLDLVARATKAHNPSYFLSGRQDTNSIELQFNFPLYQGGQVNAKVRESRSNKEKAEHDLADELRISELQTSENFLAVTNGIAKVTALEQAVKSNESALHSTKMGRDVGLRTSVDVLNAQHQLFVAKRDLANARYDYVVNYLKLKSSVGTLGQEDVATVDKWLSQKGAR